jgi:hypothetical protein
MISDTDGGIDFTETVAAYFQAKFKQKTSGQRYHVPFPDTWDLGFLQECDQAVRVLVQAFSNQSERKPLTI